MYICTSNSVQYCNAQFITLHIHILLYICSHLSPRDGAAGRGDRRAYTLATVYARPLQAITTGIVLYDSKVIYWIAYLI